MMMFERLESPQSDIGTPRKVPSCYTIVPASVAIEPNMIKFQPTDTYLPARVEEIYWGVACSRGLLSS